MRRKFLATLAIAFCVFAVSCNKDNDDNNVNDPNNPNNPGNGSATMSVRLTDAPGDYDAVLLDIQQVGVTMSGSEPVTLTPVFPGQYDLLHFRNGTDTLLMRATVPTGNIEQIRLVLGPNNFVVVDGISHPLTTPSGQTSGIKLNLHQALVAGAAYDIWLDFDAAKSIHQTGNGKYMLKPVIRAYSALTNGRIKGYVLPNAALATVYAINGVDTFAAIPFADGFFRISGLPEGSYTVWYDTEVAGFQDVMVPNVQVTFGAETDLGTITLVP